MKKFTLYLDISEGMIDSGIAQDCEHCPVALAIQWAIAENQDDLGFSNDDAKVEVGPDFAVIRSVYFPDSDKYFKFEVVENVNIRNFTSGFDDDDFRQYVGPEKFSLEFEKKS